MKMSLVGNPVRAASPVVKEPAAPATKSPEIKDTASGVPQPQPSAQPKAVPVNAEPKESVRPQSEVSFLFAVSSTRRLHCPSSAKQYRKLFSSFSVLAIGAAPSARVRRRRK